MEKLSYIEKYIKTDEFKNNDYIVENTYNMILLFEKNNIKITTGLEYLSFNKYVRIYIFRVNNIFDSVIFATNLEKEYFYMIGINSKNTYTTNGYSYYPTTYPYYNKMFINKILKYKYMRDAQL